MSGSGASVRPSPYVARKYSSSPRWEETASNRSAIVDFAPVSTNVIRQLEMSVPRSSTSRPPFESTKSFERASL
jgi:hypothetical protein